MSWLEDDRRGQHPTDQALFTIFQELWTSAVDAATSDDFRTEGELDATSYLNYQRRVFTEAAIKVKRAILHTLPVHVLKLSGRAVNGLQRDNIHTVGDLVRRSEYDLLDIRELGMKTLEEIKERLNQVGLALTPNPTWKWDHTTPSGNEIQDT